MPDNSINIKESFNYFINPTFTDHKVLDAQVAVIEASSVYHWSI